MTNKIPYIVGVTGGSASGKTSFLKEIGRLFRPEEVCILSQDNYYKTAAAHQKDENGHINYDLPECIDLDTFKADMLLLKAGQTVKRREYRFQHEEQMGDWLTFNPAPILIIEGLFIFYRDDISVHFDLKLFVEAQEELQLERRLKRDTLERNIPAEFVKYQWDNHVMPAYRKYLEPYRSEADIVINNNKHFNHSLKVIEDHFRWKLREMK
ncbi:MAG: uridine kinase [Bacteroidia bacterium]|jgi:uridine kinase|nr:uridine kinase [Bacteroidia bacterium]